MRKQHEAAVQQEQERWAKLRRRQQQERKEAEQALDELFFAQHDRGEEREGLMGQVLGARARARVRLRLRLRVRVRVRVSRVAPPRP